MKFNLLSTTTLAFAMPAFAASCERFDNTGSWEYRVRATGVDDIPGRCGGLWDNLKRFAACPVGIIAECSRLNDGSLYWDFMVGKGCNGG